jgi:hypothetical protein
VADPPDLSAFGTCRPVRPLAGGHRNAVWLVEGDGGRFVAKSKCRTEEKLRWLFPQQTSAGWAGIVPDMLFASNGQIAPSRWTLEPDHAEALLRTFSPFASE